jgi:hypothetical protein
MSSDPALLEAFRKQCATVGPALAFMAWLDQEGVDRDDLINIVKEFDRERLTDVVGEVKRGHLLDNVPGVTPSDLDAMIKEAGQP